MFMRTMMLHQGAGGRYLATRRNWMWNEWCCGIQSTHCLANGL